MCYLFQQQWNYKGPVGNKRCKAVKEFISSHLKFVVSCCLAKEPRLKYISNCSHQQIHGPTTVLCPLASYVCWGFSLDNENHLRFRWEAFKSVCCLSQISTVLNVQYVDFDLSRLNTSWIKSILQNWSIQSKMWLKKYFISQVCKPNTVH